MAKNSLLTLIRNRVGQGHRDDYIPLVRLSRSNISKSAFQSTGPLPGYQRAFHLLTNGKRILALLMLWLGALDVRESFPLWPFDHPHPLADWPYGKAVDLTCIGMSGVRYTLDEAAGKPRSSGSGLQAVDLMVTKGDRDSPGCLLIECAQTGHIRAGDRPLPTAIRVKRSRQYALLNGMAHHVIDPNSLDETFVANLDSLADAPNTVRREVSEYDLSVIHEHLARYLDGDSICGAVWHTASALGKNEQQVWNVFDALAWYQKVDIDLATPVYRTEPMVTGGQQLKAHMRHLIFGD